MKNLIYNQGYLNEQNKAFLCELGIDLTTVTKILETLSLATKKNTTLLVLIFSVIHIVLAILFIFNLNDKNEEISSLAVIIEMISSFGFFIIVYFDIKENLINKKVLNYILDNQLNSKQNLYKFRANAFCIIFSERINCLPETERINSLETCSCLNNKNLEVEEIIYLYFNNNKDNNVNICTNNENLINSEVQNFLNQVNLERIEFQKKIFSKVKCYFILSILIFVFVILLSFIMFIDYLRDTSSIIWLIVIFLFCFSILILVTRFYTNYLNKPFYERIEYLNNEACKNFGIYISLEFLTNYLFIFKFQDIDSEAIGFIDINSLPKPPKFESVKNFVKMLL